MWQELVKADIKHVMETYDPLLVSVSLIISILASWVALDLASRMHRGTTSRRKLSWLSAGSVAMGLGIWSMHYIGMLAYRMKMPVLYDWPTVLMSMIAAIGASALALRLVSRSTLTWEHTAAGGVVMGGAIASMHYIGMDAMRMPMTIVYSWKLVLLSIVAAMVISMVGLRLTFGSRSQVTGWSGKKALSALVMGLAIPTMHYLGMAAASYREDGSRYTAAALRHAISIGRLGEVSIVLTTLLVLAVAIVSASVDRRVAGFQSTLDCNLRNYTQLQQHLERLQGAFRAGGFGVWECDPATGLFYVDPSLRDLFCYPHDGLPVPSARYRERVHPEDRVSLEGRWIECLARGDQYDNEFRILRADGEQRRLRSMATILRGEDGVPNRVLGITWDVTAERLREQEIREQALRFRLTLEAIGDAVIATDDRQCIAFLNPVAAKLTGWSVAEAVGQPLGQVFRTELWGQEHSVLGCLTKAEADLEGDAVLQSRDGSRYDIRQHMALLGDGHAAVITFQDVTEARRLQRDLLHTATHDALTGLLNREALEHQLDRLWEESRSGRSTHCLAVLDLDRFKIINDSCGHLAGDHLLQEISTLMLRTLAPTDFVARMGGDEFMLLMVDTSVNLARLRLERLLDTIASFRFPWQEKAYNLTASIGMVAFNAESPEPAVLLSQADAAAYLSKRNGRNRISVFANEGLAAEVLQEMQIAAGLRRCIEEDGFELYAQPIVPLGTIDGSPYFEVLVRMRGENGTILSPALFLPAAERFGLMGLVDRWVISRTLGVARLGEGCRLAINLSAESLSDSSLWDFVSQQFKLTGANPADITFEITETGLIGSFDTAREFLGKCRRAGISIALDDFGTGLSSLSYLKQFSLDVIKIDGTFIRTLVDSPLDQAIVRSVCDIARSLNAKTVAECVEDAATMQVVQRLEVDWVQGWATGRPAPLLATLEESARMVRESRLQVA